MKKKKKMRKSSNTIASSKPFRRARTKIKKPKFLSLSAASAKLQTHPNNNNNNRTQPGSFPGHPDDDPPELSMADHMFAEAEGPTTLTGLLNGVVSSSATTTTTTTSGVSYAEAHEYDSAARSLVRTAMRREREEGGGEEEEKWVSISEVVVETAEEEVTSGGGLWLKLDYEGVLNAWQRKEKGGPFCVGAHEEEEDQEELPQTVPDMDQYGVVSGTPFWGVRNREHWSVPENNFNVQHSGNYSQTGGSTGEEGWKIGIREASVLRYKEKRRNRLFAKRIRYEVRKLNAEKRPRIKGRFVRRGGD